MPNPVQREELLRRIDLIAEFQRYGGRVPARAYISSTGWQAVHSVDREDKTPSAAINVSNDPRQRGLYVDHAPSGKGNKSFFDLIAQLPLSPWMTGREVYNYYLKQTGLVEEVDGQKVEVKIPPTPADIERFQRNLTPEIIQYLKDKRGFTEATIEKYQIGWCTKRERNALPLYDENGTLINVRFHNSKKKPKTMSWGAGFGHAQIYGLDRLAKAAPGITVVVCEGELDKILVEQESGLLAVSSTNGAAAFKAEWVKHFHGFHVVLLYDSDSEGREGVTRLLLPAFKSAVESGEVLSVKVVWLYDKADKEHKDFTDWIVKDGGTGKRLKEIIHETEPYSFVAPVEVPEEIITLDSFDQIDRDMSDKRVTVPLQVYGETTMAYHAVTRVSVSNCQAKKDGTCTGRTGHAGACNAPIEIPRNDRMMISAIRANESVLQTHLRNFVCDQGRRPAITYDNKDRITIREVYAHQVVGAMSAERVELVEHPIYVIGGNLIEIGKYQATGRVLSVYKDQQVTMLVEHMERMEEDYQSFTLEKYRANLEKLKRMSPEEIANDLAIHVTRIYERPDLHLGVLMLLCSPLGFDFPGEGNIRGWLTAIVVGDTGTGKTTVSEGIFNFAGVGNRVSGMTASRTGITYGCEHDERRGWRIKAGALLKMNRQALIVDEAQDIAPEELKTMAEGLDSGLIRIDKIQNKVFESKTRVLFGCNPVKPRMHAGQRTMDSFRYGCEAIKGIFPEMMIRRIDFVMSVASWDIEDKDKIYFPEVPDTEQQVMKEDLRALLFYAWNLKPEQIIISKKTAKFIRQIAKSMSDMFGGADDLPIVYSEDFRKTMARAAVAYAVLDLSTNDDFSQIRVEDRHVGAAYGFFEAIYVARNCKLDKYAKAYRQTHGIAGIEDIVAEIDQKLSGPYGTHKRFHHIMYELLRCRNGARVRKSDLADEFDVTTKTIQDEMTFFKRYHLIDPNIMKGYSPEPRLFQVCDYLERMDPVKYCFERYWRDVYEM